jgi:hypothetical protein
VAGTALHNMLFMLQRPAAVIVLMQPGWCDRAWRYVNQAALLGIEHFVVCPQHSAALNDSLLAKSTKHPKYVLIDFASEAWMDGPLSSKFQNLTLPKEDFLPLFLRAYYNHSFLNNNYNASVGVSDNNSDLFTNNFDEQANNNNNEFVSHGFYPLELYVANANCSIQANGDYEIALSLEFRVSLALYSSYELFFESFPYLGVCLELSGIFENEPFADVICSEMSAFNMYSTLRVYSKVHILNVHLWIKTSPLGAKMEGSDAYLFLDTRLSRGAGYDIVSSGKYYSEGIKSNPLIFDISSIGRLNDPLEIDFLVPEHPPHHQSQRAIRNYIMKRSLSERSATTIVAVVTRSLFQYIWSNIHKFPAVQLMPSAKSPFVFFHIDKCAGTSIRK